MKTLTVTTDLINNELAHYQGNTRLKAIEGEKLTLLAENITSVRQRPGYKGTFSILGDGAGNRWSLNDKFKKLII